MSALSRLGGRRFGVTLPVDTVLARRGDEVGVDRALAQALRQISAATRAGHSLQHAFEIAGKRSPGRVGAACGRAAGQMALGATIRQATSDFATQVRAPSAQLFAQVVAVQHRRGGDLGELCHRLARILHERGRLQAEARSATAQARFTARAVLALPVVLALGMAWIAPGTVRALASPGAFVLGLPALLLLVVGILVIRRVALDSVRIDPRATRARDRGRLARLILRAGGRGRMRQRMLRCGGAGGGVGLLLLVMAPSPVVAVCALGCLVGCGLLPILQERERAELLDDAVSTCLPHLLELSIALLAAGASPHETLVESIPSCPTPLRGLLAPAAAQVTLGRSAASALLALEVVHRSPELEAWATALTDGSRYGAPASDTLETLLRDARAAQRERFRQRAATAGPRIQLATVLLVVPAILWIMLVSAAGGLLRQLESAGVLG